MIAALIAVVFILAVLVGLFAFTAYAAQDQAHGLLAERNHAEARAEAAELETARLRARASGLLPGDGDPVYRDVARRLALVPEGGDESA